MPHVRVTVDVPDAVWIGGVSRAFPGTTFRVLSAIPSGGDGFGLLRVEGDSIPAVLDAIQTRTNVSGLELLGHAADTAVIQFETSEPLLLLSIQRSGAPLELPVTIRDGAAALELTASQDRLSALGDQFDDLGISYTLEQVHDGVDRSSLLSDEQRDLLVRAVERGYYDTPRECTLTELAEAAELAKSTASVTLHRAEERVIKQFVTEAGYRLPDAASSR